MKKFLLLLIILTCAACSEEADTNDIFSNFVVSPSTISADGESIVDVSVELTDKASTDRRNIVFSTTSGKFTSTNLDKCTIKAEYEAGVLIARTTLKVSTKPGAIEISVQPEFDSPVKEFSITQIVHAVASVPKTISLESSSFGVASNHLNEVLLTGNLKNIEGKPVSSGYKVGFTNFVLPSGTDGSAGQFRDTNDTTAAASEVTSYFSANALPIGTSVKIVATLLNLDGSPTEISDSIVLTINQ